MEQYNHTISILSFAREDELRHITQFLSQQQITYQVVDPVRTESLHIIYGIAIFVVGETPVDNERVLTFLHSRFLDASLVIFFSQSTNWDNKIIRYCDEFLSWPFQSKELHARLNKLIPQDRNKLKINRQKIIDEFIGLHLIGRSPSFIQSLEKIKKISAYHAPVLIEGETGTGKELAARAIHYLSDRQNNPFVPVNCGAIPDDLLENELFGHERGAYTDAKGKQAGLVSQADGGTLFFDEIDTLSSKGQVSLLRFLQDQEFRPLGSDTSHKADVRIIAATNKSLATHVEQGLLREDLYYRLHILSVTLPPLRAREGDAELLAEYFLEKFGKLYDKPVIRLSPRTRAWLRRYQWPGNIRQLENLLHREYLLADGQELCVKPVTSVNSERRHQVLDRRKSTLLDVPLCEAKQTIANEFERTYLCHLLARTKGNVTVAANLAGKERRALGKLLKKYGIDKNSYT